MKKLIILTLISLLFLTSNILASEINVKSSSSSEIVLEVEANTLDLKIEGQILATSLIGDLSNTYVVPARLDREGENILIYIDIESIEDYNLLDEIKVSGVLLIEDEELEFSKRIAVRTSSALRYAPPDNSITSTVYWITGLIMIFIIFILGFLVKKTPSKIRAKKTTSKKRAKKKKTKKKKKKSVKKKVKKKKKKKTKKKR